MASTDILVASFDQEVQRSHMKVKRKKQIPGPPKTTATHTAYEEKRFFAERLAVGRCMKSLSGLKCMMTNSRVEEDASCQSQA